MVLFCASLAKSNRCSLFFGSIWEYILLLSQNIFRDWYNCCILRDKSLAFENHNGSCNISQVSNKDFLVWIQISWFNSHFKKTLSEFYLNVNIDLWNKTNQYYQDNYYVNILHIRNVKELNRMFWRNCWNITSSKNILKNVSRNFPSRQLE